MQDETPCLSIN